ncbi:hypothetical protein BDZ85DRAFT_265950 [Elsinoe ampelina]|uniref:C2H2-type domain-containing protein n=1 Tax=Elsinoe ampelina TaxID=302913 RepID=A0A6A6G5S6_9PEZI|nr:hypothetical protein BDZ85DRAFT_265950 [Elsinoe ampelina]
MDPPRNTLVTEYKNLDNRMDLFEPALLQYDLRIPCVVHLLTCFVFSEFLFSPTQSDSLSLASFQDLCDIWSEPAQESLSSLSPPDSPESFHGSQAFDWDRYCSEDMSWAINDYPENTSDNTSHNGLFISLPAEESNTWNISSEHTGQAVSRGSMTSSDVIVAPLPSWSSSMHVVPDTSQYGWPLQGQETLPGSSQTPAQGGSAYADSVLFDASYSKSTSTGQERSQRNPVPSNAYMTSIPGSTAQHGPIVDPSSLSFVDPFVGYSMDADVTFNAHMLPGGTGPTFAGPSWETSLGMPHPGPNSRQDASTPDSFTAGMMMQDRASRTGTGFYDFPVVLKEPLHRHASSDRQSGWPAIRPAEQRRSSHPLSPSRTTVATAGKSLPEKEGRFRTHPHYTAKPKQDGMYHCPFDDCAHQPTPLKCNYDKFIDSHIKPFRCRNAHCSEQQFSSTACLLRHEREAHGLHGHGERPNLCQYQDCDRARPGNGFPRHYNLMDHMRRVHGHETKEEANTPSSTGVRDSGRVSKSRKKKGKTVIAESSRRVSNSRIEPATRTRTGSRVGATQERLLQQAVSRRSMG